jgi:hypothetical protein
MWHFPPPPRAPQPLPFEFYAEHNNNMPNAYPDDDEKAKIRNVHRHQTRRWHTRYVVCTAPGTTPDRGMHYSRCILSLWPPPVTEHVVEHHILAHSCPEDLLSGIHALLARLKLNRVVHPTNQCNVLNSDHGGSWYMLNHALARFSVPTTPARRVEERLQQYDYVFNAPHNRGKLTLLNIHVEKTQWWHTGHAAEAALKHAAAAN